MSLTEPELRAIHHALQGAIPDELYAGWCSAGRKVERALEEVRRAR